jgi:hypothetical protein
MPDKKIPVSPPKAPVVKVQIPIVKYTPIPGPKASLVKIQDSLDRKKQHNQ